MVTSPVIHEPVRQAIGNGAQRLGMNGVSVGTGTGRPIMQFQQQTPRNMPQMIHHHAHTQSIISNGTNMTNGHVNQFNHVNRMNQFNTMPNMNFMNGTTNTPNRNIMQRQMNGNGNVNVFTNSPPVVTSNYMNGNHAANGHINGNSMNNGTINLNMNPVNIPSAGNGTSNRHANGNGNVTSSSNQSSLNRSSSMNAHQYNALNGTNHQNAERTGWEFVNVNLNRVTGYGFGIAVSGGRDNPHFMNGDVAIAVSDVIKGGPAEGKLQVNDRLLSANGMSLENVDYATAVQVLRECGHVVTLLVKRRLANTSTGQNVNLNSFENGTIGILNENIVTPPILMSPQQVPAGMTHMSCLLNGSQPGSGQAQGQNNSTDQMIKVILHRNKKEEEFGIVLGCRLYVKEVINRSIAEKENIREGDILVKINTTNADNLTLKEAKKAMESCKERLQLTLKRDLPVKKIPNGLSSESYLRRAALPPHIQQQLNQQQQQMMSPPNWGTSGINNIYNNTPGRQPQTTMANSAVANLEAMRSQFPVANQNVYVASPSRSTVGHNNNTNRNQQPSHVQTDTLDANSPSVRNPIHSTTMTNTSGRVDLRKNESFRSTTQTNTTNASTLTGQDTLDDCRSTVTHDKITNGGNEGNEEEDRKEKEEKKKDTMPKSKMGEHEEGPEINRVTKPSRFKSAYERLFGKSPTKVTTSHTSILPASVYTGNSHHYMNKEEIKALTGQMNKSRLENVKGDHTTSCEGDGDDDGDGTVALAAIVGSVVDCAENETMVMASPATVDNSLPSSPPYNGKELNNFPIPISAQPVEKLTNEPTYGNTTFKSRPNSNSNSNGYEGYSGLPPTVLSNSKIKGAGPSPSSPPLPPPKPYNLSKSTDCKPPVPPPIPSHHANYTIMGYGSPTNKRPTSKDESNGIEKSVTRFNGHDGTLNEDSERMKEETGNDKDKDKDDVSSLKPETGNLSSEGLGEVGEWETRTELMKEENFEPVAMATGLIDENGGVIESHETGVALFIPPGALGQKGPIQITFEVGGNPYYVPDQQKDENLVTPLVSCGPVGLEFRSPVYLRMPRTSGVDPLSWSLKSGRSGSGVWDTTAIQSNEIMVSDENFVSIPLDYF